MIDPDDCCEFCYDVAVALAATNTDPAITADQATESEYTAIHAHAHPDDDQ